MSDPKHTPPEQDVVTGAEDAPETLGDAELDDANAGFTDSTLTGVVSSDQLITSTTFNTADHGSGGDMLRKRPGRLK